MARDQSAHSDGKEAELQPTPPLLKTDWGEKKLFATLMCVHNHKLITCKGPPDFDVFREPDVHPVNVTACFFFLAFWFVVFFFFFRSQRGINIGFRVSFDGALDIISRR